MATWNPFQNLSMEQVLNGNDVAPVRVNRPKSIKVKKLATPIPTKEVKQEGSTPISQPATPKAVPVTAPAAYYGEEGETIEFKTSFFYKERCIKETEQMYDVLKEVCAFLNHKGGVIYMGVDDETGKPVSLQDDFNHLRAISNELKRKGKTIRYFERDGYVRWINGKIRKHINLVRDHNIAVQCDFDKNNVLVITVPKGVKDVARVDGTAYIRRDREAVKMSEESQKELRELRKKEAMMPEYEKKAVENAKIARQAINCKKKAVLHSYSSGNSRKVSDRVVEIFKCDPNNSYIYAYEISTGLVKQFKLCRAESIEILDELCENEKKHVCQNRDVFNMSYSNESPYENVEIELTLRAKILLEEEYPNSKNDLKEISQTKWILNTTVANVLGVGRFCMGLLDEIQIVQGDMLRTYITGCLSRQLNRYCL